MDIKEISDTNKKYKKVSAYEYFRFIIGRIENEMSMFTVDDEFHKKMYLLKSLKSSTNLLEDIFLISKVKKLELLATYLLFILKKIEENQITFENLVENFEIDKEFIKRELSSQIKITPEKPAAPVENIKPHKPIYPDEVFQKETLQDEFLSSQELKKEEELPVDEPILSEDISEEENNISEVSNLELISQKEKLDNELEREVFSIPKNEKEENIKKNEIPSIESNREEEEISEIENINPEVKAMDLNPSIEPDNIIPELEKKEYIPSEDMIPSKEENSEEEHIKIKPMKFPLKESVNKIKKLFKKSEKEEAEISPIKKPKEEEIISEVNNENPPEPEKIEKQDEPKEIKRIHINPITEQYKVPQEKDKSLLPDESKKTTSPEEIEFTKYENEVKQTNKLIRGELDSLLREFKSETILSIIESSSYMAEYSARMSFELIAEIYNTILIYFDYINKSESNQLVVLDENINNNIKLFLKSLIFIEKFVGGDDYEGSESLIKEIETIKDAILAIKAEKERLEKLQKEKEELEKQLGEKFSDTEQRKKLLQLKNDILEVESIFKSIDSIKGEFQTYEAFRILSQTYSIFKDIVIVSNLLEINKMASLSESSYIFLKYIQNYRMNPFSEEIKEVLKYIIVNFKLLFLGKPVKDLDVFISYLNNPEKIFTQKEENTDE